MHTVRSDQIKYLERPSVYPGAQYKPGVVKPGKWWNPTPGYQSFSVALGHSEFEWLRHNAAEEVISVIENTYGKRRSVVEAGYDRSARRLEAGEPGLTLPGALQQQMQKDWISWEPNTIFPWRPTRRLPSGKDEIMVPKQVANQIQEIYKSHDAGFRGAWDKTMKVYQFGIFGVPGRVTAALHVGEHRWTVRAAHLFERRARLLRTVARGRDEAPASGLELAHARACRKRTDARHNAPAPCHRPRRTPDAADAPWRRVRRALDHFAGRRVCRKT